MNTKCTSIYFAQFSNETNFVCLNKTSLIKKHAKEKNRQSKKQATFYWQSKKPSLGKPDFKSQFTDNFDHHCTTSSVDQVETIHAFCGFAPGRQGINLPQGN